MILELAELLIHPGQQAEFEAAIERGLRTVHARAHGRHGWQLHKCVETPERYVLQVMWDSIEAHMVTYRESPLSLEFRPIVAPFLAQPPAFQHFDLVATGP